MRYDLFGDEAFYWQSSQRPAISYADSPFMTAMLVRAVDGDEASVGVAFSNVQGGWPGFGNINQDPLFLAPEHADYHLGVLSPCLDASLGYVPRPGETDIDGEPRLFGPAVDMGADEYNGSPSG